MEMKENSRCSILFHLLVPGVILSSLFDHGCDLGGHVEDGVAMCRRRGPPSTAGPLLARADRCRRATFPDAFGRRVGGFAGRVSLASFAQRLGELSA